MSGTRDVEELVTAEATWFMPSPIAQPLFVATCRINSSSVSNVWWRERVCDDTADEVHLLALFCAIEVPRERFIRPKAMVRVAIDIDPRNCCFIHWLKPNQQGNLYPQRNNIHRRHFCAIQGFLIG
jgi:hypothetical protein